MIFYKYFFHCVVPTIPPIHYTLGEQTPSFSVIAISHCPFSYKLYRQNRSFACLYAHQKRNAFQSDIFIKRKHKRTSTWLGFYQLFTVNTKIYPTYKFRITIKYHTHAIVIRTSNVTKNAFFQVLRDLQKAKW